MNNKERLIESVRRILPSTGKTTVWIIKLTTVVSFAILLLRFFNILPFISDFLSPVFIHLGLPGEAALAYVSGYFVNVYSAIAVAVSLGLNSRSMTILMTMVLCSHNMIVEIAVQKKTGASAVRAVLTRTLSAIVLALILNRLLPGAPVLAVDGNADAGAGLVAGAFSLEAFWTEFQSWLWTTVKLALRIAVIIFSLNILQSVLKEFGVLTIVAKFFRPLMLLFGLRGRCSFLWLIANIVGLAYGAAAMIDEVKSGTLNRRDILLTNAHIGISHSNLEDLTLTSAVGGIWWIMLLSRWGMSLILVWGYRLEMRVTEIIKSR